MESSIGDYTANEWLAIWPLVCCLQGPGDSMECGFLVPYSGKLSREKTFMNWWKIRFSQTKLLRIVRLCRAKEFHAPNFREKTFANSHKTAKFAKVFSFKSFLLYGICFCIEGGKRPYLSLCKTALLMLLLFCVVGNPSTNEGLTSP